MINCHAKSHIKLILLVGLLFFGITILYAQGSNVKISIKKNDITIKEAFQEIEKQTGMSVAYNQSKLKDTKKVTLNEVNTSLNDVLNVVLKDTGYNYELKGDQILIVPQKMAQQVKKDIKGQVTDDNNETVIGASVTIKGTTTGTMTDVDGYYTISASKGDVIVFSYLGYETREKIVGDGNIIDIKLYQDSKTLDDVVVTALGIRRSEKALSYNAEKVAGDLVNTVKDASFINSLSGKVAGVNINASSSGLGGSSKVIIRGQKSIEGNNNVLYVVDGVPMMNSNGGSSDDREGQYGMQPMGGDGIGDINSDDIETMTVLKGAAASALYGSSAANGAIIITTKKGQAGKVKVTYSNQSTFSQPFVMPKFQSRYGNKTGQFASWGDKLATPSSFIPEDFFNTGTNIQNTLSVSTGTDKHQTYLSASTTNATGIIPNNQYNRYNFSARHTTSLLNDKLTFDIGANYILQNNQNMTAQGEYFNPLVPVYLYPRGEDFYNVRLYKEYNAARDIDLPRWNWGSEGMSLQNPYWITNKNLFGSKRYRYIFNGNATYKILDWLSATGRIKVDNTNNKETIKLFAGTLEQLAGKNGNYARMESVQKHTYADFILSMNKYFGEELSLDAHVGTIFEDQRYELTGARGDLKNANFFALRNINAGHDKTEFKEDHWAEQTHSIFASAELGWRNMLYLSLTARNEWSSALARMPQKSFFYPSVGLSGVVSEMVKLPEFFNYVKVRGSFANVGNTIPRHISMLYYDYDPNSRDFSQKMVKPITELYPEKTTSWEVGLDTRFWKNRFNFSATFYLSNTKNQTITGIPVSPSSMYKSMTVQTGNVENKGMELSLGYNQNWGDFSLSSNLSASINLNKIKSLGHYKNEEGKITKLDRLNPTSVGTIEFLLEEGGTVGDIWGTNRLKRDENGYVNVLNGKVTTEQYMQKLGSVLPRWNFGFNNTFSWKDIHVGFVITARTGGKVVSFTESKMDAYGVSETTAIARDNGGIPVNNGNIDAQTWYQTTSGIHSNYVYSATNVRLQEASIGYSLPRKWFNNKLKITTSLVGRNLWMIYNKAPFDPESVASTGNYYQGVDYFMTPSLKNIGFSFKVEF